ncbi:ANNEXIN ARABIDOPSIS THALIANA 5, annexin 5 [Hibiscus trionum]|uniref:Annexin n=1 Tax=Hibiscus trionum TaxID=183268 RepID=A0A9W7HVF8_HIBTR|nr:ANNEXIN ARABIDOPSIS THALIANA 5, annexin 5 [Hibiscus trionum]
MSTVTVPPVPPSYRDDASQIFRAFKGIGCDAGAIVEILAHRDAEQRSLIEQEYESSYGHELRKRLSSELNGHLKKAVLLWMHEPGERDSFILKKALKGTVKDQRAVTEIICARNPSEIGQLKRAYYKYVGTNLEDHLEEELSGDHKKLVVAFLTTSRYDGPEYDEVVVEKDTKALNRAAKKLTQTGNPFVQVFSERSRAHLCAVSEAYKSMFNETLDKAIRDHEANGNYGHALKTILRCAENQPGFYAKAMWKAMKGLGTDDTALVRIVVTRAEIDMQYIKAEYLKNHGKTLNDAIRSDTSGHYRAFLLALIGSDN